MGISHSDHARVHYTRSGDVYDHRNAIKFSNFSFLLDYYVLETLSLFNFA